MSRYDNYIPEIIEEENIDDYSSQNTNFEDKGRDKQHITNNKLGDKKTYKKKGGAAVYSSKSSSFFNKFNSPVLKIFLGIIFGLFGTWLLISMVSFLYSGFADQSMVSELPIGTIVDAENKAGEAGARLAHLMLNDYFGIGSIVIVVWLISISLKLFGLLNFKPLNFTIKCIVALLIISLITGLFTIGLDSEFYIGGYHGYYINNLIINFIGWSGSVMLSIFLISLFVLICLGDIIKWCLAIKKKRDAIIKAKRLAKEEQELLNKKTENLEIIEEKQSKLELPQDDIHFEQMTFNETDISNELINEESNNLQGIDNLNELSSELADENKDAENASLEEIKDIDSMKVNVNQIGESIGKEKRPSIYDPTAELSKFKFPPYDLLNDTKMRISVDQEEQKENQEKIRKTLLDFDIPIVSIEATVGPTVTLYEIVPDKGVRIAKIRNLVDDIALSLSAIGVRIIAPIPGKGTVGIEVANKDPQTVSMRTIITSKKYQESKFELPIALGSTISNDVYIADLAKMPHLLVAGATGQGKSVGLNAIITSLLYRKHPAELKFVLIDPKMVEFSLYARLEKHYLAKLPDEEEPIITDPSKVVATLSSLCVEMDNRYNLLKDASTRNIKEYNAKFISKVLNPEKGHKYLPYIVVIVDEFSDLIMTAGKEVEMPIARIAQKARAVGIHMIIATQRPSTNVITGIIKANFPARMAFKVSSGVDSKTILDTTGAQQLIGRGDMLLSSNNEMERVQCAFIDTPEVNSICEFISKQSGFPHPYLLPEPIIESDGFIGSDVNNTFGDRDPLFDEIARKIVNSNTASTSSLQRHYSIGYNRAGKIMDQMEAAGIVGPAQGGKPRAVLIDPITLESILNQ